jgi:hypothetical protein
MSAVELLSLIVGSLSDSITPILFDGLIGISAGAIVLVIVYEASPVVALAKH